MRRCLSRTDAGRRQELTAAFAAAESRMVKLTPTRHGGFPCLFLRCKSRRPVARPGSPVTQFAFQDDLTNEPPNCRWAGVGNRNHDERPPDCQPSDANGKPDEQSSGDVLQSCSSMSAPAGSRERNKSTHTTASASSQKQRFFFVWIPKDSTA